jgi:DnaJ-domain-containing protein 1
VSIGDRFINLLRSNINAVFERGNDGGRRSVRIEELSDNEIEAEMIRRRARREAAERAADGGSYSEEDWAEVEEAVGGSKRYRRTGRRNTGSYQRAGAGYGTGAARRAAAAGRDPRLAQLYAQLECTYGSDLTAVRKAYRAMMRKYHPDMHSLSPEKQRVATELSQRLTSTYNELKRVLSSPGAS